jgi:hypothetical protein
VADRPVSGVEGSTRDACFVCSSEVWISPATRRVKEDRNGQTICLPCAARAKEENAVPDVQIDPRQLDEIAENVHRGIHDEFMKGTDE